MVQFKYFFSRSTSLFLLAMVLGITLHQGAEIGVSLTLPALTVILTVTLLRMPRGFFRRPGPLLAPSILGIVMSYLVLGNLIIWSGYYPSISNEGLWVGIVLVAAVPPAVSIIPLSKLFRAEPAYSFAGLAGAYMGAILIAPLIGLGFLKYIPLNYTGIILLILELIVLPLGISRLAVDKEWDKIIEPHEGRINDWCFFIVFYALVASCYKLAVSRPLDVFFIALIAVASTFLVGFIIEKAGKFYGVSKDKTTSILLLGTLKNYGLAGGIALTVFNKEAALPAMVFIIIMFLYEIWLKARMNRVINIIAIEESKKTTKI
jgi:bile acid:Na+ symporter, BASS family